MNKADLERALKKTVGAALKPVQYQDEKGNRFTVQGCIYDNGVVVLHGAFIPVETELDVAS